MSSVDNATLKCHHAKIQSEWTNIDKAAKNKLLNIEEMSKCREV